MGQPRSQKNKLKLPGEKWKWEHNGPKSLECTKSSSKRKFYRNIGLHEEARKISNKQPNLTPKGSTKEEKHKRLEQK